MTPTQAHAHFGDVAWPDRDAVFARAVVPEVERQQIVTGRQDRREVVGATGKQSVSHRIPCITTLAAAAATIQGLEAWLKKPLAVSPLQQYHAMLEG